MSKQTIALAVAFSKKWENANSEVRNKQIFLKDFLSIFGVTLIPSEHFEYEVNKSAGGRGYIDCLIKEKIAIEVKSRGENLNNAFKQLKEYMQWLPEEFIPKILMVCDFETIILDINKEQKEFKTKDLRKHLDKFSCLSEKNEDVYLQEQEDANKKAAKKMAKLHEALEGCGYTGHSLEVYLVRLLFCLFAEDTGIFDKYSILRYIEHTKKDGSDLSEKIARLFEVLNMSDESRKKKINLPTDLLKFEYINGGLFAETLPLADFTEKMRATLIECAKFDWSHISPAIFGSMFQDVMDKEKRREIGAHYTSEENILKLIKPLFMDSLHEEFEKVKNIPKKLDEFHSKIANLKFLDPACGCGNFLIIAYRELRKLELKILERKIIKGGLIADYSSNSNSSSKIVPIAQGSINIELLLRVSVGQFYGIEYEEFPCQIARVGMWLTEHQMNMELDKFGQSFVRVPLTHSATIKHGNALRIDWENIVPKGKLSYVLGNPPFAGARIMSANSEQKMDMLNVFGDKFKCVGNLDYVCAWYKKAADYTYSTNIKCAFVSTNSISQGEQVALLWKPLIEKGICINFCESTFKWSNEGEGEAAVYCIIVGFSYQKTEPNINPYLVKGPTVFIESRSKPLCKVLQMDFGNMPNDAKGLLSNYTTEQKNNIISKFPETKKWFKKLIGAEEFINNIDRWCLWLKEVPPSERASSHFLKDILTKIKDVRAKSKREATRKLAETPYLFGEIRQPTTDYIIIPSTSSEHRKYIPIGFLHKDIIVNNSVHMISNATLYHFGILTSSVHNAWIRSVCGRLKNDYRYSKDIVYNNFPWPEVTREQKVEIEKLAQDILNAREKHSGSSFAALYGLNMPQELLKTHQALDRAVMKLYGFGKNMTEADIVASLMEMYRKLIV